MRSIRIEIDGTLGQRFDIARVHDGNKKISDFFREQIKIYVEKIERKLINAKSKKRKRT